MNSCHLAVYDFLVEGALDWRMVSTTSVERPDAMSCVPSGATPTASTTLGGGEKWCPLPVRGYPTGWECPMESFLAGLPGLQTMDGPASTGLLKGDEPCPGELSPELPGAEQSGGRHTNEASATPVPWHPAPVELDESERTRGDIVRCLET